ncbi:beta-1,4-glucuronyltransferase 1-like isoform X2 [Oratosquilla oratoria]
MALRNIRRWQRTALLAVILIGGAWLLLGAPCSLFVCPGEGTQNEEPLSDPIGGAEDGSSSVLCTQLALKSSPKLRLQSSPQLGEGGSYQVVLNYLPADRSYRLNESVTYSTHATPEFLHHVEELATRWTGPVSVAVYVPNTDFCLVLAKLARLRACGSRAIRENVSWHLYWHKDTPPAVQNWRVIPDEKAVDCYTEEEPLPKTYRSSKLLPYPVNVARNVARSASTTQYVLPSDVELFPSSDMIPEFLAFMQKISNGKDLRVGSVWPRIYIVPTFEVATTIPSTKEELVRQYAKGEAVYFHRLVCNHCQKFPGITDWVHQLGSPGVMKAFSVVRRQFPYHRWEPIYISTKDEPFYDERLSWEGLQDKMTQMHEFCLRGYSLVILDRAFLVHSPGIKRKKTQKDNTWREPFVAENSRIYDNVMEELEGKFGSNEKCRRH